MLPFTNIQIFAALGIMGAIAFVGWDYANAKSKLASREAEVSKLRASIKAIETTHNLNLAALKRLDDSCVEQMDRFLKLRDIDKIIKESTDPIGDALKFNPNKDKK
jgi:hypothetical protein